MSAEEQGVTQIDCDREYYQTVFRERGLTAALDIVVDCALKLRGALLKLELENEALDRKVAAHVSALDEVKRTIQEPLFREVNDLEMKLGSVGQDLDLTQQRLQRAEAEAQRLREALETYATHTPECVKKISYAGGCTCGLERVLSAAVPDRAAKGDGDGA